MRKHGYRQKTCYPDEFPRKLLLFRGDENVNHGHHACGRRPRGEELPARCTGARLDGVERGREIFRSRPADDAQRGNPKRFRQSDERCDDEYGQDQQGPHPEPAHCPRHDLHPDVEDRACKDEERDKRPALCPADRALDRLAGAEREIGMADPKNDQHGRHTGHPQPHR